MHANERCGSVEKVERVPELHILGAMLLTHIESRADLLHLFFRSQRPQALELGVVQRQTDGDDSGQKVYGSERAMVVVDMVYVDDRVPANRSSNGLVPGRVEDGRAEIIHARRVRVGLCLCSEDGTIEKNVGDVVEGMGLHFDEVWLAKDNDLDRFSRVASRVFQVLDFGHNPDEIDIGHRFAHKTRHDTQSSNLDLELPVDDFVLEGSNKDLAPLGRVFRPANDILLAVLATEQVMFLLGHRASHSRTIVVLANDG